MERLIFLVLGLTAIWFAFLRLHRATFPLPPGPRGWPIVGNAFQIPFGRTWLKFEEWGKKYGPIYTVHIFSKPIVVCTTSKSAGELLDKQSAVLSDRPRFIVAGEILSKGMHAGLVNYGELHRKHRRILNNALHLNAVKKYAPIQTLETRTFLRGILQEPGEYEEHSKRFAASVIMTTTYNHPVNSLDDPIVKSIYEGASRFANTLAPGAFLVEALPFLKNLPVWLPGMKWKRDTHDWAREDMALYKKMVALANESKVDPDNGEPFVHHMLNNQEKYSLTEDEASYLAGVLFAAATETVASAICAFILFMAAFPDIQRRARDEILASCSPDSMPNMSQVEGLPYLQALMKETLRFRPPAPLAVPHCSTQDIIYNGYMIPKGTTVIGAVWSIHRDPSVYYDPDNFIPERFIENPKLPHFTFGFGRRACPGNHHAYSSLTLLMASLLWAYEILPGKDKGGQEKEMDVGPMAFTEGGEASRPYYFDCELKPRIKMLAEILA